MIRIFLIAGEPSGDKLGASLMQGLKTLRPDVEFFGVGGPLMAGEGQDGIFPMKELSVMGLAEILPKYRQLKARLDQTVQAVIDIDPDILITIDSPDFCLRVARQVKEKRNIRTVHYVAPSVWAWRAGRAAKMAKSIDQVLAILPFEPPFMEAAGMQCDFVGHPIAAEPNVTGDEIAAFRAAHNLGTSPTLLVLPGSRTAEVSRLTPIFGQVVAKVTESNPDLRVIIPAAPSVDDLVREKTANWPGTPVVLSKEKLSANAFEQQKRVAFAVADTALAASGTVSLELAAAQTPMVIAYDMNWFSWQILSRMVKTDTVTLVNLVSETRAVPEFLGPKCEPGAIAQSLIDLMSDDAARAAQIAAMDKTMKRLGQGDPTQSLWAAKAVIDGAQI